ncbi:MAG: YdcF family protein [Acidobacteria bacterium]|nr:YdcF family protein [Acidobacteriota bacterium]
MSPAAPGPAYSAPPRASWWSKLGPGGLASFLLALAGGLLLLPVLWRLREVLRSTEGQLPQPVDLILVLGRRLEGDAPTPVFQARLHWGAELWRGGLAPLVCVAGGLTGKASLSEAQAGRAWLESEGLPTEAILVEDRSQHTLENLFNVRELMRARGLSRLILVSDPLHLARASALARGLGLAPRLVPAVACPPRRNGLGWWARALHEAFLLHWYHTGVAYSRLIRSERQLSRIT